MKKLVFVSSLFLVFCLTACNSKQGSQEEKNEIKSDSVDIVNTTENIVLADTWPDIKMLADLVRQEKTEPQLNDAPFISYLVDSIGFKEDTEYNSYCRKLKESNFKASWLRDSDTIRFEVTLAQDTANRTRFIRIGCTNFDEIWKMVVKLQEYGLRRINPEDGHTVNLAGKGLHFLYQYPSPEDKTPFHVMVLGTDTLDEELFHWLLDAARRYEQR